MISIRWRSFCPADGSVRIDKVTTQRGVLVLAGPRSREVLAKVADIDVSNEAFPWLTARRLSIKAGGHHRHAGQFRRRAWL